MRYRYKPRNRRSAEEIAAEKAEAERLAMTCQCCARRIYAQTGVIAHHGYQRPSWAPGNQTASCMGARHLPYEADRARLGDLIRILERDLLAQAKYRFDRQAEREPLRFTYSDYSKPIRPGIPSKVTLELTRANFAQMRADHIASFLRSMDCYTFDEFKARKLRSARFRMMHMARELRMQRKRFAEWKQTHLFDTYKDGWITVAEAGKL